MRARILTFILFVAAPGASQAGEVESRSGWTWHPSAQVFGSLDEIGDATELVRSLADVSPGMGMAASCESAWEGRKGRAQASAFGLLGNPFADGRRTYFLSGRLHAVRDLGRAWRMSLDDSARWQRRDAVELTNFRRNEAIAGLEWRSPRGPAIGLRLSDRRRALPNVPELGFSRQGATLALRLELKRRVSLELSGGWQHYSALTAEGSRATLSAELARLGTRGVASLRLALFGVHLPSLAAAGPTAYPGQPGRPALAVAAAIDAPEAGAGTSNNLVENAALEPTASLDLVDTAGGTEANLLADPLLFDPLESESDEWDFGRNKLVLLGFVSRRLGSAWQISAVARWQHRSGPSLLADAGSARPDYEDEALAMRVSLRRRLTPQLSALMQGCYLKGWGDYASLRFSRGLVAVGLQYRY